MWNKFNPTAIIPKIMKQVKKPTKKEFVGFKLPQSDFDFEFLIALDLIRDQR